MSKLSRSHQHVERSHIRPVVYACPSILRPRLASLAYAITLVPIAEAQTIVLGYRSVNCTTRTRPARGGRIPTSNRVGSVAGGTVRP